MKQFENIQSSREYQAMQSIEKAINSTVFNPQKFAASVPLMHRTLQQSFWRAIRACIEVYADDQYRCDLRNKAAHEEAKAMLEYLNEQGRYIPFI